MDAYTVADAYMLVDIEKLSLVPDDGQCAAHVPGTKSDQQNIRRRGPTRAIRTRSIWVRRAASTSAFRSNSDVAREVGLALKSIMLSGGRGDEDVDQDAVLLRGSGCCDRSSRSAADISVQAPLYVPTWTGCYVGGHAGYGWRPPPRITPHRHPPSSTPTASSRPANVHPGFRQQWIQVADRPGASNNSACFFGVSKATGHRSATEAAIILLERLRRGRRGRLQPEIQPVVHLQFAVERSRPLRRRLVDVYHLYATAGVGGAKGSYAVIRGRQ